MRFARFFIPTILFLAVFTVQNVFSQRDYRVRFRNHTELFPENFKDRSTAPFATNHDGSVNGMMYRFVQFQELPNETARAEMQAEGLIFFEYLRFGAYLVGIPQGFDWGKLEKFAPRSVVEVNPLWKIAPNLNEKPYGTWAVKGDLIEVNLQVYPNISIEDAAKWCAQSHIQVVAQGNQNGFLQVRFHPDELEEVAALAFIKYLELVPPPGQKEDTGGRSLHRSNLLDSDSPMGKHYNGEGQKGLTRDDGAVGPHIDFQGRLHNMASEIPGINHADGVTGIIGGAGNLDPTQKGMASGAELFVIDYINNFQDNTLPLHQNEGVNVTNSSYSDGCNDGYTLASQTVDKQIFENPSLMHVFSAGNNGGVDCGYGAGDQWGNVTGGHKMAKNAIATANLYADAELVTSSSRGPATDGRIKPDIAAHGQDQGSTDANNTYQVFGGTSAAAPGIAGCLLQLHQAYKTIQNGQNAPSALLKAAILVTANDLGNKGPDFQYGWGHINANRALNLLEKKNWVKSAVQQGSDNPLVLSIPDGVREARVMIYWADPEASEMAATALINDLDLNVISPNGTVSMPYRLNSTPVAAQLNTPAGFGRDSLNNMEEIALQNPAAGDYIVNIKGYEVPFGPQEFYLVWEFLTDEIAITYPTGGESLVPGESMRIHWDAFGSSGSFVLRYTADGNTWNTLTTQTGDKRMYSWTVPNTVTGKAHFMLLRGAYSDTTAAFSIAPVPTVTAVKICPDSMTVQVTNYDSLEVEVFVLGQKYMEIVGKTDSAFLTFPIANAGIDWWYSARTLYGGYSTGQRAVAKYYEGGLLNCPQPYDVSLDNILSPRENAIVLCQPVARDIKIKAKNEGLNVISSAKAVYQIDNQAPVVEVLPDVPLNDSIEYTFQTPALFEQNGVVDLKIWIEYPIDFYKNNDTLQKKITVVVQPETGYYAQDFNAPVFPPANWALVNPDEATTWKDISVPSDASGEPGRVVFVNNFNYSESGQRDYLYMVPIDLTGVESPGLEFDVAYRQYSESFLDSLQVEVFQNCDVSSAPVLVYSKSGSQLTTVPAATQQFFPTDKESWRTEALSLQQFEGQRIIIRFANINGFGNNLFLDNARIIKYEVFPPVADFSASKDSICRLDSVLISSQSGGNYLNYKWTFGAQANPSGADSEGPHWVKYITAGNKNIRLIVNNPLGADTLNKILVILGTANANFNVSSNQNTIQFTNTSTNADTYLWDFGDGNSSTEKSPLHVYSTTGIFPVKLTATNRCRVSEKTVNVNIATVGLDDLQQAGAVLISPNPNTGLFNIELNSLNAEMLRISMFDAVGRLVKTSELFVSQGIARIPYGDKNLAKGIYQLKIETSEGHRVFKVVVD